jgi:hypothetical protein
VNLGGRTHGAPAIEVDTDGTDDRYVVTVVGTDGRVWRIPVSSHRNNPRALGGWTMVPGTSTTLAPDTMNTDSAAWGLPRIVSLGGPNRSVLLVDPDTGQWESLGGGATSPADLAAQPDGSFFVFVRGNDRALWMNHVDGSVVSGWTSLGGVLG